VRLALLCSHAAVRNDPDLDGTDEMERGGAFGREPSAKRREEDRIFQLEAALDAERQKLRAMEAELSKARDGRCGRAGRGGGGGWTQRFLSGGRGGNV
jgi:hypothetical protein